MLLFCYYDLSDFFSATPTPPDEDDSDSADSAELVKSQSMKTDSSQASAASHVEQEETRQPAPPPPINRTDDVAAHNNLVLSGPMHEALVKVKMDRIPVDYNRATAQLQESISYKAKGIDGDYTGEKDLSIYKKPGSSAAY